MPFKDPTSESARASRRKHYHANKEQYYERVRAKKAKIKAYLSELKEKTPCTDCGQSYRYYVMQFDHRDPSKKSRNMATIHNAGSWKLMFAELAKCDVVCSNCHLERSYGPNGNHPSRNP